MEDHRQTIRNYITEHKTLDDHVDRIAEEIAGRHPDWPVELRRSVAMGIIARRQARVYRSLMGEHDSSPGVSCR